MAVLDSSCGLDFAEMRIREGKHPFHRCISAKCTHGSEILCNEPLANDREVESDERLLKRLIYECRGVEE